MIVIYDKSGTIYTCGDYPIPSEIQYLETEIPDGKYLEKIDTSVTPHEPVFKEYPKSELELLRERVTELEAVQNAMITGE